MDKWLAVLGIVLSVLGLAVSVPIVRESIFGKETVNIAPSNVDKIAASGLPYTEYGLFIAIRKGELEAVKWFEEDGFVISTEADVCSNGWANQKNTVSTLLYAIEHDLLDLSGYESSPPKPCDYIHMFLARENRSMIGRYRIFGVGGAYLPGESEISILKVFKAKTGQSHPVVIQATQNAEKYLEVEALLRDHNIREILTQRCAGKLKESIATSLDGTEVFYGKGYDYHKFCEAVEEAAGAKVTESWPGEKEFLQNIVTEKIGYMLKKFEERAAEAHEYLEHRKRYDY